MFKHITTTLMGCFWLLFCDSLNASVATKQNVDPQLIEQHTIVNNTTATQFNYLETVIDKVNETAVQQNIYALRRLAKAVSWPHIKFKQLLFVGDKHQDVFQIKKNLFYLKFYQPQTERKFLFTANLKTALVNFQIAHGLNPDGIIGPKTLAWLNTSPTERANLLLRNYNRQKAFFDSAASGYLLVNIPQFQLNLVHQGKEVMSSRVIVGKKQRPTPILNSKIQSVVLNPSWNVPRKIVRRDLLPKIRKNQHYLSEENFEVFDYDGNKIELKQHDWSQLAQGRFPFKLTQKAGPNNALGKFKFHFKNEHSVYLHDTPDKNLFDTTSRALSSGCIRVEKADELAVWFKKQNLENQFGWQRVLELSQENKWFKVKKPYPVHLVYWTAWVDKNNQVHYRSDIYDIESNYKINNLQLDTHNINNTVKANSVGD